MTTSKAIEIQGKDIFWVGARDWSVRNFHGYTTHRGTSYNAYLITGDTNVLIDTVKAPFFEEMMERISSVIDPTRIDCIVSNHSEMDHSGSLPRTIAATMPSRVLASSMGARALAAHFPTAGMSIETVSDGQEVLLGSTRAVFIETRMLHWPDSMFTYLPGRKLLFSQDAFGMHLASTGLFDDQNDTGLLAEESAAYYANILMPYSGLVGKLLERVGAMGLELDIIAPDHGPVWRRDPQWIIGRYASWSSGVRKPRLVIAYDTMWGSTARMANAMLEGASLPGVEVRLIRMDGSHRS
ncbi:FprA family A-type flavoprotein, partial [Candidatus Fermentibacterales bacterium]|nr:FprA family A-type flavoprotein [Candidatus Fermentibacterales bacterium]